MKLFAPMKFFAQTALCLALALALTVAAAAQKEWVGTYEFEEDGGRTTGGTAILVTHELRVVETDDGLVGMLQSNGYQTSKDLVCKIKLEGAKLLLVQPLTLDDQPRGTPLLTIDSVGAGVGEKVLIVIEGRAAGDALRRRAAPVDAAIIGIVDRVTIDEDGTTAEGDAAPRRASDMRRAKDRGPRRT